MSEINRVGQETTNIHQNPIFKQALIADEILDKSEKDRAEKKADEYHDQLHDKNVIDGGGRTKEAQLAQIIAGKKSV